MFDKTSQKRVCMIKELINDLVSVFKPEIYHGFLKKGKFFEGWYYKITDRSGKRTAVFIPGISKYTKDRHSFIQFFHTEQLNRDYFRFESDSFKSDYNHLGVTIDRSSFSSDSIQVEIDQGKKISGDFKFTNLIRWPVLLFSPGIMGFFGVLPFMECYYDLISTKGAVTGKLKIDDQIIDFDGGSVYIEKNWGSSFPSEWIWLQANRFNTETVGITFSYATIPFLGTSFKGLVCGLSIGKKFYKFATYNGGKVLSLDISDHSVKVLLRKGSLYLEIEAQRIDGAYLPYPTITGMNGTIYESISGNMKALLYRLKGGSRQVIFEGVSDNCGVEITMKKNNGFSWDKLTKQG